MLFINVWIADVRHSGGHTSTQWGGSRTPRTLEACTERAKTYEGEMDMWNGTRYRVYAVPEEECNTAGRPEFIGMIMMGGSIPESWIEVHTFVQNNPY